MGRVQKIDTSSCCDFPERFSADDFRNDSCLPDDTKLGLQLVVPDPTRVNANELSNAPEDRVVSETTDLYAVKTNTLHDYRRTR